MTEEEKMQSLEEWLEEEKKRLKEGFAYEPPPSSQVGKPGAGEEVLAGLGLGAGVVGGAVAPHPNPVTFEGCKAVVIAEALRKEMTDDDTRLETDSSGDATVVTVLHTREDSPYAPLPAVTVNMLEAGDTLTVTVSDLNQDTLREALSSMGGTVVDHGKRMLFRRRGIAGLFDAAGNLIEGADDLIENIQDMGLPRRVWKVIDRVGGAAEEAYLDQKLKEQALQRKREEAERAWTHCPWCGRGYAEDEKNLTSCPACGGTRGPKPDWLK